MIEVIKKHLPGAICFKCRSYMKEGQTIISIPFDCRHPVYKKRNRKLKGDKVLWFHAHEICA